MPDNETPSDTPAPEFPFEWMPLEVGDIEIVGWDGYSYVDRAGRTYWSGVAEPTAEDAADAVSSPRVMPLPPRKQETRIVIERLTAAEKTALFGSTNTDVRTLIALATATGIISEADANFASGVAGLNALGIIAANRWDALLAP